MKLKLLFACIIIILAGTLRAQDTSWLIIEHPQLEKQKAHTDEAIAFYSLPEQNNYINTILVRYYQAGYITATANTIHASGDTITMQVVPGKQVFWTTLNVTETDAFILSGAGYRKKDIDGKLFNYTALVKLMRSMLNFAEQNGFPFATVNLDSIQWNDTTIAATLQFKKNQFIEFDTLRIVGNLVLSPNYLKQYTGIESGGVYNQQLLNDLDNRLKEIPFAVRTKKTRIEFSGNRATVIVYLDEKQSSTFDFLIGVLPNNEITGRLIITGEGRLQLQNIFNAGELFNFHFSKLESTSKELQTALTYPYLPGLPLGLEGAFSLYLKDSTFLERTTTAGILYQLIGNNHLKAVASFYNSAVLSPDTAFVLANLQLPASLDLNERAYGLTWNFEKLNYRFNPYKGFAFNIGATVGTKTILENATITGLSNPFDPTYDFASLYDSVDLKTLSIKYHYTVSCYIPLITRTTLLLKTQGAAIINDYLLQNELYRIGGNAIMRGFDEQSITASQYHIATAELRYLLSQNAFAALFVDAAYTENAAGTTLSRDTPIGFGAAVNFETKAGIFGLTYALGSQQNNPVSLRNTKIHFGYVNYF